MTLSAKTTSFTLHPLSSNPQPPTPFETVLRCVQFPDEAATGRPRLQRSLNFPSGHVSRISKSHLIEISNEPRSPSPVPRLPIPSPITDTPRAHPRVASLHLQEARIKEKKEKSGWEVNWEFIRRESGKWRVCLDCTQRPDLAVLVVNVRMLGCGLVFASEN